MTKTILLVDDEADIREVVGLSLVDMGYRVHEAASGSEALEVFQKEQPPVVLTDIKMPGMDGIKLLQEIKRQNPETEVIMITGHGDMDLAVKSLKHEATDFITKPINVGALEIALQRARERILTRRQLREYTENLERLVKEKTELQSRLASLGLMIGSISHGIKGLLTGLDSGMYLMESGLTKADPKRIQDGWDTLKTMVERIRKMVTDILYYAKERELRWERIDAAGFADEVTRAVASKMADHGVRFIRQVDEGAGNIEIDQGYLQSALINMLDNALEACTRDTGKKAHRIVFKIARRGRHVVFEVSDDGTGMDPETMDHLFTPFFSSKGEKGTGLGLFVANQIVEQHGGRIQVSSTPGRGTSFAVRIPAKRSSARPASNRDTGLRQAETERDADPSHTRGRNR